MAESVSEYGRDAGDAPPLVSVILPAFNAEPFVARAIDSVLEQTYPRLELLVVDDASTDATVDVVRARARQDNRMSVLECATNAGPAAARNIGLDKAVGEWIALIDADDAWRSERLARLVALVGPDVDWAFDGVVGYDAHLKTETGPLFGDLPPNGPTFADFVAIPTPQEPYDFGFLKPFMRRRFLLDHELRYDEQLRSGEDFLLGVRMLLEGARGRCTSESLYVYTTRVGELSGRGWDGSRSTPHDNEVAEALEAVCRDYADRLAEMGLVRERIEYLHDQVPVEKFRYALRRRDPARLAKLLVTEPAVRKAIRRKSSEKLGRLRR